MLIAHESKVVCVVAVVVRLPSVRPPASANDNAPLPSVFKNCPLDPSAAGNVKTKLLETVAGASKPTNCPPEAS